MANTSVDDESSFVTRPPRSRSDPRTRLGAAARCSAPNGSGLTSSLISIRSISTVMLPGARSTRATRVSPTTESTTAAPGSIFDGSFGPRRLRDLAQHQGAIERRRDVARPDHGDHESTHDVRAVRRAEVELAGRSRWPARATPVTALVAARVCTMNENSGATFHGRPAVPSSAVPCSPVPAPDPVVVAVAGT